MDKNAGGAKPKTGTGTNHNNNNNRQGGSGTQTTGTQPRNRSPRRENGYAARFNGAGQRGSQSSYTGNSSNNAGSNPATSSESAFRRASVPNSVARARNSSTQTRPTAPQRFNDYSPLRGGRTESRNLSRQNNNAQRQFGSLDCSRPVLRQRMRNAEPGRAPLESPLGDLPSTFRPLCPVVVSSDDSDSGSCSPRSSSESSPPQRSSSFQQLSVLQDGSRPQSTSQDAVLARELLQTEMDMMLQRDEEMARELQEEFNSGDNPSLMAGRSLAMFMPSGQLQARGRHFPSMPGRQEVGRSPQGRDYRGRRGVHLMRGPDGAVSMGMGPPGRSGGLRFLMGMGGPGGRRMSEPDSQTGTESGSGPISPDDETGLPSDEFDPDERLLAGGLDPPDDFLSMMNDPSLMLLMLLLRAPDTLYQNEAGVDLDDYEGLWALAERLGEVRRRGISEDQINQLPTLKFKSQNGEASAASSLGGGSNRCQICLVDFENGDCLRCIPCKHDFHRDCIDEWLKRNATCPICRQDIKPSDRWP